MESAGRTDATPSLFDLLLVTHREPGPLTRLSVFRQLTHLRAGLARRCVTSKVPASLLGGWPGFALIPIRSHPHRGDQAALYRVPAQQAHR